jgi:hypothetical protein
MSGAAGTTNFVFFSIFSYHKIQHNWLRNVCTTACLWCALARPKKAQAKMRSRPRRAETALKERSGVL